MPSIPVVVPSYNSRRTLGACLKSLRRQILTPEEIIVVDSSSDDSGELAADHFPEVRLIRLARRTPAGTSRNIGVEACGGDRIAFLDADCAATPEWLGTLVEALDCTGASGVLGAIEGPADEAWPAKLDRSLSFSGFGYRSGARWVSSGPGASMLLRRHYYQEVGGSPDLPRGQDTVLLQDYSRAFGPLWFEPRSRVLHLSPGELEAVLARQRTLGWGYSAVHGPGLRGGPGVAFRAPGGAGLFAAAKGLFTLTRLARDDRDLLGVWIRHPLAAGRCLAHFAQGISRQRRGASPWS